MPERVGQIPAMSLQAWHDWLRQQPLSELLCSRYAQGRRECYYGWGVTLHRVPTVYPAQQCDRVQQLGDRWLPGWHSALLCEYRPGVGIHPHRDHTCFAPEAILVNFGEAIFVEYPSRERVITPLEDGVIVRLHTKILHAVPPVVAPRYSLTFRHLKPAYHPAVPVPLNSLSEPKES